MAPYCCPPWPSTDHWRTRSSWSLRWSNRSPWEYPSNASSAQSRSGSNTAQREYLHWHRRRGGVFVFLAVVLVHTILTVDLLASHSKSLRKKKFLEISDQILIENQAERVEVRVFGQNWSGEAIKEKEKEILDPRKVFSLFVCLFFFFLGK